MSISPERDAAYLQEMKINVQLLNEAFEKRKGRECCWWSYTSSHKTFELLIGHPARDNIMLVMASCKSITGPLDWITNNLNLVMEVRSDCTRPLFILTDDPEGVRVTAEQFWWENNYDLLRYRSLAFPEKD
jgi:hypothetical protein